MQYDANDDGPVVDCSQPNLDVCRDCGWPPPNPGQEGKCWARQQFQRFFANEYGTVEGGDNMKKEIYKRGPIGMANIEEIPISFNKFLITLHCFEMVYLMLNGNFILT